MKTFSLKTADANKEWIIIDAEGAVLGRLASYIAKSLRGKDKPTFTPHVDCGSNVIVTNAEKIHLTGKKLTDKVYHWHTGYVGSIKSRTPEQILESAHPERVLMKAVERMMPRGSLGRQQMTGLRVFAGTEHPHDAQQPRTVDFKAMNAKNARRV
ncbi:50S ribosomal protein L13 [Alphaproteobacteria bacterium]|nr:50S ribosomal protein L13 [Alphaproteobacteria bacterium]